MKSLAGAAAASALLLTAIVLPSGGASAKTRTVTDPGTADVWARIFDEEKGSYVWAQPGSVDNFDVLKVQMDHGKRSLKLRATYSELKEADAQIAYVTLLKLPDGTLVNWAMEWEDGEIYTFINEYDGQQIKCDGLAGRVGWKSDVLTMSLPRSCIDRPAWVKFKGRTGGQDNSGEHASYYLDPDNSDGRRIAARFSDKVKAG